MFKKTLLTALLLVLILGGMNFSHAGALVYLVPMPMPTQYRNTEQYQEALNVWENVHKKIMARSTNVQLPPMPVSTQYRNLDQYERALEIWERVGNAQGGNVSITGGNNIVRLTPMPMPTQYKKFERYQRALQAWIKVSRNTVVRNTNVQPPHMPMPTQYRQLEQYQNALIADIE